MYYEVTSEMGKAARTPRDLDHRGRQERDAELATAEEGLEQEDSEAARDGADHLGGGSGGSGGWGRRGSPLAAGVGSGSGSRSLFVPS